MKSNVLKYLLAGAVVLLLSALAEVPDSRAQDSSEPAPNPVPLFWRLGKPDPAPDLSQFPKLRIITGEERVILVHDSAEASPGNHTAMGSPSDSTDSV